MGNGLDVDVRLVLRRDEVPAAQLGKARLGHIAWLAPKPDRGDAADLCMRTLVGFRPEIAEAAAWP
ncbi:UNVERIFIED_ORG: putative component of type VI protein secretion system [Rhizobium etli]